MASTEVYKLNMEFTKVTSPIDGQISRYYLTLGNLVNQDSTLLTTVVSLDPMYAYFEMDEPTLLRIRRAINDGRMKLPAEGAMPVLMGLQGEDGYPARGDHQLRQQPGQLRHGQHPLRGVFPNPRPPGDVPRVTAGAVGTFGLPSPLGWGSFAAVAAPASGGLRWAPGCCRPACSCASACRSANRTRPCWSSTGPSGRTRG